MRNQEFLIFGTTNLCGYVLAEKYSRFTATATASQELLNIASPLLWYVLHGPVGLIHNVLVWMVLKLVQVVTEHVNRCCGKLQDKKQ